jgi:hypothetical protein
MELLRTGVVEVRLSGSDVITSVGGEWDQFANGNDGGDLGGDAVIGSSFWSWVAGAELRLLLSLLLRRIRDDHASVIVPYRCDSPTRRRYMCFEAEPMADGGVCMLHTLLREEVRGASLPFLDRLASRGPELVRMCGWCNAIDTGAGTWLELDDAVKVLPLLAMDVQPAISHGICPSCDRMLSMQLEHIT